MTTDLMTPASTLIKIADGLEAADLDGETVLLDVNSGHYFGLNEVGSRIVELVREPTTIETVIDTMATEYDVDRERLAGDVSIFIGQMIERKLIHELDGTSQ